MPTEIDFCIDTELGEEEIVSEHTVKSGNILPSDFLAPAKVLISCEFEDRYGSVIVSDNQNGELTDVRLYENEDDIEGKPMPTKGPIKFSKEQSLTVWSNNQNRQIHVYHERKEKSDSLTTPINNEPISV